MKGGDEMAWKIAEMNPEDPAAVPPITILRSPDGAHLLGIILAVKNKAGEISIVELDVEWSNNLFNMLTGTDDSDSFVLPG